MRAKLARVKLDGADMPRAFFHKIEFSESTWNGANLSEATFMETASKLPDFTENNMEKTLFVNCALDGAKLTKVRAPMLVMQKCSCRKITAEDCDLTQIVAMETDFTESGFARCRLCLGGFIGSNMTKCSFAGSDLTAAHFARATLALADLSGAPLEKANFAGADLSYANLSRANLKMADLSHARVMRARFDGADLTLANGHAVNFREASMSGAVTEGLRPTDERLLKAENFMKRN